MDKRCDYCNKIFSGQTEKQINNLIKIHKLFKHKAKIKIDDFSEEEKTNG